MDQLDVNLSELRVALVERRQTRTSKIPLTTAFLNDGVNDDKKVMFGTSTEKSGTVAIEPEPVRSWFQRLFGA